MNYHFFIWYLLVISSGMHASRIINSVPEKQKYEYISNIFKLLYDEAGKREMPLRHLMYKALKSQYHIPQKYKKILKKYGFYAKKIYTIDSTILRSTLIEYTFTDDDEASDDRAEEMPRE